MKKILLSLLLLISIFMLMGCSSQTTTSTNDSTPLNQDSLLDSLSQAIKNIFD